MNSLAGKFASGIARLIPVGKQADDPISNTKAATRWLESLPIGDAYKCQQAILGEIKRFNENSTQFTKDRLAVLMLLDERARDLQDTLVRQYLRNPRMSRLVESQLWHAVYGLFWEVARGYHSFVLNFSRAAGKSSHEDQIPLITLRAIQSFGQLLKWRMIRYLPAGEKLWLRLHNLYRVAETEGFHRTRQRAYADGAPECSCESAYTHIMMLDLANSGSLYPKQLDLLDRWLCGWHEMLQLDTQLDTSSHTFVIDLSADHGPRRVRKPDPEKPMRFWATDELLFELNELQTALREGKAPAQLGLTEGARTVESLELLDHLQHHWASLAAREQRRAPRELIKRLVDVTHGFSSIVDQFKFANAPAATSPYGSGLNYDEVDDVQVYGFITDRTRERASQMQVPVNHNSSDVERWVMHDESECGYGAVVESRDKDWLRVGALICAKSHDATTWQLGIVRRLSRLNDDTSSVGIETLAGTPVLVMLYDTTTPGYTVNGFDNSGAGLPHTGLWLTGAIGTDQIIIDPAHYMPGKVLQIQGVEEREFIALGNPVERSEGWIRVVAEPVNK
ncbi:MAG: hypothetical protein K8F26_09550 [Thiobacillus sp.]|jgi:hypothetical protein|nr:hypothetical protein [Thiobacillus sp.]